MKSLNLEQMESLDAGSRPSKTSMTGYMCGAGLGIALLFGPLAPLAAAPAIGCLIGLAAHTV